MQNVNVCLQLSCTGSFKWRITLNRRRWRWQVYSDRFRPSQCVIERGTRFPRHTFQNFSLLLADAAMNINHYFLAKQLPYRFLPTASEGWGKAMFSVCSHPGGGGGGGTYLGGCRRVPTLARGYLLWPGECITLAGLPGQLPWLGGEGYLPWWGYLLPTRQARTGGTPIKVGYHPPPPPPRDVTPDEILDMLRLVCLLRSCRRTFL